MEKKITLALIALLLNLVCFTGVLFVSAYLVSSDKVVNSMTVGNSSLEIKEDFDGPAPVEPGAVITKKVSIKNTGLTPAGVRVMTVFSDSRAQKYAKILYNTAMWKQENDGYWYYKKQLQPGEVTEDLFENVTISADAPAEGLGDFEIIVYSECVNTGSGGF